MHLESSLFPVNTDDWIIAIKQLGNTLYIVISDCSFFSFFGWGETESTWYVGHYLAYCTSPGWWWWWVWSSRWNEWVGEPEVLRETLHQCHFVRHESHMTWPGLEPGLPLWNILSVTHERTQSHQFYETSRSHLAQATLRFIVTTMSGHMSPTDSLDHSWNVIQNNSEKWLFWGAM
jgi:hypothetical protein